MGMNSGEKTMPNPDSIFATTCEMRLSSSEKGSGSLMLRTPPDLLPPHIEQCRRSFPGNRLNLVIPIISEQGSFGGVKTALRFFERLSAEFEFCRILVTRESRAKFEPDRWPQWVVNETKTLARSIAFMGEATSPIAISAGD